MPVCVRLCVSVFHASHSFHLEASIPRAPSRSLVSTRVKLSPLEKQVTGKPCDSALFLTSCLQRDVHELRAQVGSAYGVHASRDYQLGSAEAALTSGDAAVASLAAAEAAAAAQRAVQEASDAVQSMSMAAKVSSGPLSSSACRCHSSVLPLGC